MFHLIGQMLSCVFIGLLISLVLIGILYFLPRLIVMRYSWKVSGILVLTVFFFFAWFQTTLLSGGFKVKGSVPTTQQIGELVQTLSGTLAPSSFGDVELGIIEQRLTTQYPLLSPFLNDMTQKTGGVQGDALLSQYSRRIHQAINYYLLRRTLWLIGGLLVAGVLLGNDAIRQSRRQNRLMQMDYFT